MKKYNVAVVGATGNVGREILNIIDNRKFPLKNLVALASEKSNGHSLSYGSDKEIILKPYDKFWKGIYVNNAPGLSLINNTKTYEAKAYVEAKDKSISPEATKNTSGITINKRVGIMTKTDWCRFGLNQTSGAPIKKTNIKSIKYPILPNALPLLCRNFFM